MPSSGRASCADSRQRAATLGFELVNRETGEILEPAISFG